MQRKYILLLGRPGSGKSAIYERLASRLSSGGQTPIRIDDFVKLEQLAELDDREEGLGRPRQFTSKEKGGWLANELAYEKVLRCIDSELLSHRDEVVFVEFSRPDIVRSIKENFSESVRKEAFLVYVYCPLGICLRRNRLRAQTASKDDPDAHEVPETRMRDRYSSDDHDRLDELGIPFVVVDNHLDNTSHLDMEAEKVLHVLGANGPTTP